MISISPLRATHIVGGEMTYTCLGNDEYEIELTIFRDCFNGNPAAWFDDPASIGIFDVSNNLLDQLLIPLMGNDTLNPVLSSECFVVPPNVCVHTTTYRATVTLPPIPGGYQLAYQRCCRNVTIVNIIDPLDSGATYGVTISEQALLECNSSPKFNDWPPIYICVNEPIIFDQSAVDADGDSIVYRLCTPLLGATPDIPMPQPPNPPPYDPINWLDPPYNEANMLNGTPGDPPLEINLQTGLLTGLPNTIGQFVVGICAEEYRNGTLISTTRRDFQYNVGLCGQTVAAFTAPTLQCGNFNVEMNNLSEEASDYLWLFGDPNNPGASSTIPNVNYTYSEPGTYTVTLIADPNTVCADTATQEVTLALNSLSANFDFEFVDCSDVLTIEVTDASTDTISQIVEWNWVLQPGGISSMDQNPEFEVNASGDYVLSLTVIAENGCVQNLSQTFEAELIDEVIENDVLSICPGDTIGLNTIFDPNYNYSWAPAAAFDDPSLPNPLVNPAETTTYTVTITDDEGFCVLEDSVMVEVPIALTVDLTNDTTTCEPSFWLVASSNTGVSFDWASDPLFNDILGQDDSLFVTPIGAEVYYLSVVDDFGCSVVDSVVIEGLGINVETGSQPVICLGDLVPLAVTNSDPNDTLTYSWSPVDLIISDLDEATAIAQPDSAGVYTVFVEMENQFGCTLIDSTTFTVIDTTSQLDLLSSVQCSGFNVFFSSTSVNAPFYVWDFGDPNDPGATGSGAMVSHEYSAPGAYTVMVTLDDEEVPCQDTLFQTIQVEESAIIPDFTWELDDCSSTVEVQFTDQSTNTQSTIETWEWNFSNGISLEEQNPVLEFDEDQSLTATLIITSSDGCVDSISQVLEINIIEVMLPDEIITCLGIPVELNPLGDTDLNYQWFPASSLDDPNASNPTANPPVTTLYSVTITDQGGFCSLEETVNVVVEDAVGLQVVPDTTICEDSYLLSVTSDQNLSYEWAEDPDFEQVIATTSEVEVNPGQPTTYYLNASSAEGCLIQDSVTIGAYPVAIDVVPEFLVCGGDTVILQVDNLTNLELAYFWSPEEFILEGANTANPVVVANDNMVLEVEALNEFGCSTTASVSIDTFVTVFDIAVDATPDSLFAPGSVQLTATFDSDYTYSWTPAELLDDPTSSAPVAEINATTTFEVTVVDENGCVQVRGITVTVVNLPCEEPFVFVPNGFSPNGDGLNDIFLVRGNNIDEVEMYIYNRWGQKVFESRDPNFGWDGTFEGKELPPDVFGYYLTVNCFGGERYFKKGNVTLLR